MLGIPVRYVIQHPSSLWELVSHPVQLCTNLVDSYYAALEWRRPQCAYEQAPDWESRMHAAVGMPWPCKIPMEFEALWPQVMSELEAQGIRPGPESFCCWNDGDLGLVRAIWCLVRHLGPANVVETGVAHGVTSRFILEALERNASGTLWSIDLPPVDKSLREQVGIAVGKRFANRWCLVKGSSRLELPPLLARLGKIDLFIHDSQHTERNVVFEMNQAWGHLNSGGALVVDDIDANPAFQGFTRAIATKNPGVCSWVCEAEPIKPDLRRFNQKGLFGIVLKDPSGLHH